MMKSTKYLINYLLIIFIIISSSINIFAEYTLQEVEPLLKQEVVIRLSNGDILTCEIKDIDSKEDNLLGLTVTTKIGKTTIYANEIIEIIPINKLNRQSHRIYFLPTAEPISKNHFIGNFELLFFYAGIGITDYFSITAGRSVIPGTPGEYQISLLNAKATVYKQYWESAPGHMSVAVGVNQAWLNSDNRLTHAYSSLSFTTEKSIYTGSVYAKLSGGDLYEFKLSNGINLDNYPFVYEDGAFGIALGLDTKFSTMKDVHVIAELWNSNISQPTNTGVLLGVRIGNSKVSADFGLAFFTSPYLLPFTSFTWTPF